MVGYAVHRQPLSTCEAGDDTTGAGLSCEAQPRDEAAAAVDVVEDADLSTSPPAAEASQWRQPPDASAAAVRVVASSNLVKVVPQVRDAHTILIRLEEPDVGITATEAEPAKRTKYRRHDSQVILIPPHGGSLRFSLTSAATGKISLRFEVRLTHFDWALRLVR